MSDHPEQEFAPPIEAVVEKGRAEFADFDLRSDVAVSLAGNRPDFFTAVSRLPDAHRIVAGLVEDPDEAERIFRLPTAQMNAALSKVGHAANPAPAKAPPQQRPVAPDITDPKLSTRAYIEARDAQERTRRQPPPEPPRSVNLYDPKLSTAEFIRAREAQTRARGHRR